MSEGPLLFIIGLSALIVEPMLTRLTKKYEGYARMGTLALLILGILSLIASIPCILFELNLHLAYSIIPLGLMTVRYVWQFFIDRREIRKVKIGYTILFGVGLYMLGVFLYFFIAMTIYGARIVNC